MFEILFWLETSKNDHCRKGMRLQVPFSSNKCALLLLKNALLLPELLFHFPEWLFYFRKLLFYFSEVSCCFLELSFCFLGLPFCPKSAFLFLKNILLFSRIAFSFPEVPSFYCVGLFPKMFFSSWLYLHLILLRAAQRDNICLSLVLFSHGTIYWPSSNALHLACVHIEAINKLQP